MRPPTVNKARPGHERETEIKLFDNSKTIVNCAHIFTHAHTQVKRTARGKRRSRRWQRRTCAVCTCPPVACPLSRLGAGGNDRARAATPGLRLQIALLIFCLFSSINTLSCRTVHTKTIFPQRSLRGCGGSLCICRIGLMMASWIRDSLRV